MKIQVYNGLMCQILKKNALFAAWLIALIALLSTLFMQYFLNWPVCVLCWYQRIAIYPLVILLGIAAYRNDHGIVRYALPFCVLGFLFALYQYLEQMIPGFAPIAVCAQELSCSTIHFQWIKFITLPLLSMVACVAMGLLLLI
ncbi:MAG: disulfide bond formation protein B [uncultured bacterium]|nr:MAG: disulfide bond formation protein B [uncultured bacterium]OGT27162.1 MAG: 2-oxoglutarate dehydrogenase [Gammaproteobacteria bacterium RIFCSPHIGHO2_02_FULL_42_43]OGT50778.1 MAG: 2-oxoglutarate dehydrogenase [Gammaproteobacteria bacterium RIFCSPHIGHO2_12_FULL_41_25]OGT61763.1 MAG: 2-oxoglutarate dehydrogenase [Gammaproteobacteria bacterium RIFCSPLOWO2_02_FULL_42_14]OGT85507.1 MAG: 2-oxoglutarate dehydrogenase [Gammaproteobacteria bacterium RIFCSPLOWO2_12_FULL_42_18]